MNLRPPGVDGDRREFLRTAVRWTAAGALVAGVGGTVVRNAGAACERPSVCGACPVYSGCDLPKAATYRAAGSEVGRTAAGVGSTPERSGP